MATPTEASTTSIPSLAYYWGDDGYSVEHAPGALAAAIAGPGGEPLGSWRTRGDATSAAEIGERIATAPLFGGGTIAIVSEPMPLVRSKPDREALFGVLRTVAPGNGLAFLETVDGSGRRPATLDSLREAVAAAGGQVREFKAPTRDEMARWIEERAVERGVRLGRGAAAALAQRIGAYVREGDIDRRRQGTLAVGELEKLAVYRDGGEVTAGDVASLVTDVAPGSMWALLDAVASRRVAEATSLANLLLDTVPAPVLVSQLHRRVRELLEVADLLAGGASPASLVRTLRLKEFRARKLTEQARAWTAAELQGALEGLLELDAVVKGIEAAGGPSVAGPTSSGPGGEVRRRLALTLWLSERVARQG